MTTTAVNAYHDGSDVVLLRRGATGILERQRVAGPHVFYLLTSEVPDHIRDVLRGSKHVTSIRKRGRWARITMARSDNRAAAIEWLSKHGVPAYEGDLTPIRRILADEDIQIVKPRRVYLDIEADSRVPFTRKGDARVLCWVLADNEGPDGAREIARSLLNEWTDADERRVMNELWAALDPYDQVIAWSGDRFDFPVIKARTIYTQCTLPRTERWLWMDLMLAYGRHGRNKADGEEKSSLKLNDVCHANLGEGKHDFNSAATYEAWMNSTPCESGVCMNCRQCLINYCGQDTILLPKLETKLGVLALHDAVCQSCHIFPDSNSLRPTEFVDGFMLHIGARHDYHFPTLKRGRESKKYEGAYVMKPASPGILKNVHVADFASMYPTIIRTWNMSPETVAQDVPVNGPIPPNRCRTPQTRTGFTTEFVGILPMALKEMIAQRKSHSDKKKALPPGTQEWKDAERGDNAGKVTNNSFYGVAGNKDSRIFNQGVAEGTSTTGAYLIKRVIEEASRWQLPAIYADTDGEFSQGPREKFQEFVDYCNSTLLPGIAQECGCLQSFLKIEFEKSFERIVFIKAKKYVGMYSHYKGKLAPADAEPEIRGLEYRRGDSAPLGRKLQKQIIDKLMKERCETPEDFEPLIEAARRHITDDPLDVGEVSFVKALQKPINEYVQKEKKRGGGLTARPPHVEVAAMLKERGVDTGYKGARVRFVVKDAYMKDYIPSEDYDGTFDRNYLWMSVWEPSLRLLVAAFPGYAWDRFSVKKKTKPVDDSQLALDLSAPAHKEEAEEIEDDDEDEDSETD